MDNLLKVIRMAGQTGLLRVEEWIDRKGAKMAGPESMT